MKKLLGFTLAEVLITLTIIGVIAVLTIPNLIKKYEHKEYEAGFKKAWALSNEIVKKANVEAGVNSLYDYGQAPYTEAIQLLYSQLFNNLSTIKSVSRNKYSAGRTYSNGTTYIPLYDDHPIYYFSGNMLISINYARETLIIEIDTNGNKKPNRVGYDIFDFTIAQSSGKLLPYRPNNNSDGCTKTNLVYQQNGVRCGYYALINKNPDNQTQSYWDGLD